MDIRQLRYFIAIVEGRSFTRAAAQLHVAQPALSQHVLTMEAELGVELLHRGPRGVFPTEAGLRLLDRARIIDSQFSELQGQVRSQATSPSGEVKIGFPVSISDQLSVALIEAARRQFPDVHIGIVEGMSSDQLRWLREGVVDLALVHDSHGVKDLVLQHVLTQEVMLYAKAGMAGAPPGDAVTLADALKLPLILPTGMQTLRKFIDSAAHSIGMSVNPILEVDSRQPQRSLVAQGAGFSMLPAAEISGDVDKGILRAWRIKQPKMEAQIFLAHRAEQPLSDASFAIGNLILGVVKDLIQSGAWKARWNEKAEAMAPGPRLAGRPPGNNPDLVPPQDFPAVLAAGKSPARNKRRSEDGLIPIL